MNIQNSVVSENYEKKVKPGGILKKNKTPTKSKNLKDTILSKGTNSLNTINLNDTKNLSVEYTIESLSPIRGNSLATDNNYNLNQIIDEKTDKYNKFSKIDDGKFRDSVESDLNILRTTDLNTYRESGFNVYNNSKSKKEINVYRDYEMVSPKNENYIKINDQNWLQTNNNPLEFSKESNN